MKVLIINSNDAVGGAARSAMRLSRGLAYAGVDCKVLVQRRNLGEPQIIGQKTKLGSILVQFRQHLDYLPLKLYPKRDHVIFSSAIVPDYLVSRVATLNPDIVNLHWVCDGFLRIESLRRFSKPIVWTLHDSWAFTGGCHIPSDCTKYKDACGACPILKSNHERDLSRRVWSRKDRAWRDKIKAVVCPSNWLASAARSSSLFRSTKVVVIPNGLDVKVFRPHPRQMARQILSLPMDKHLILFGGVHVLDDKNKGGDLLIEALAHLPDSCRRSAELVVFGAYSSKNLSDLGIPVRYLGHLSDDITLSLAYSAADVFVCPSRQENLPNTVMEAMACGTPCVAFRQGGLPDLIEHLRCGYLADAFNAGDMANGIKWVLDRGADDGEVSRNCRLKVEEEFSLDVVSRKYLKLYEEVLAYC